MKLRKAKQMHSLWWIHYSFISKRSQWKQLSKLISLWRKLIEDEFGKWERLQDGAYLISNLVSHAQCFSSRFPIPNKTIFSFTTLFIPWTCHSSLQGKLSRKIRFYPERLIGSFWKVPSWSSFQSFRFGKVKNNRKSTFVFSIGECSFCGGKINDLTL